MSAPRLHATLVPLARAPELAAPDVEVLRPLNDLAYAPGLEVIEGSTVIEVRLRGVSKALVAQRVQAEGVGDCFVTAIGDDRTDEDLFRALQAPCATVVVGQRPSCARFRVADYREVRRILRELVTAAERLTLSARASVPVSLGPARRHRGWSSWMRRASWQ